MKLNNLELSLALADHALTTLAAQNHAHRTDVLQLADYLATHPTSSVFYERALAELGIAPEAIPSEGWGTTIPSEGDAAAGMKRAIAYLNEQWHLGKLQRRVAVRALAWAATLLARRLDADCAEDCKQVVARNNGSTAGLFRNFIQQTATRAELQGGTSAVQQPENQNGPATNSTATA